MCCICWNRVLGINGDFLGSRTVQCKTRRRHERPKLVFQRRTIEMASPPPNPSAVEAPQSTRSFPTNFVRIALSLLPSRTSSRPFVTSCAEATGASLYSREQSQRPYHPVFNRAYAPGMSASRRTRYPVAASPSRAPRDDRY